MATVTPVALITGASRGIGRAAALTLAKASYRLALVARTRADLVETARLAGFDAAAHAESALLIDADVTRPESCRDAVESAARHFGRLDAVVHVAGLAPVRPIEDTTPEEWRATLDTNLSAAFYLTKYAWPHLKAAGADKGHAAVVYLSSLASRDPFPGFAAYGAAKAGVNLLGLSAAREGLPHQVRVHTIAPGAVETPMFRQILSPEQFPTQNTLSPEEVAEVIAQCVTGALRHTTGEVIYLHKTV